MPLGQGPAGACNLGDRAPGERLEDMFGDPAPRCDVFVAERGAQVKGPEPRDEDLVDVDSGRDLGTLPLGESLDPAPQGQPDPKQRVTLAAAVSEGLLLHPAADRVLVPPGTDRPWRSSPPR